MARRNESKVELGIKTAVTGLILITLLLHMAGGTVPLAQSAGDLLNRSGVPLGNLFIPEGAVFILIMVSIFIVIMREISLTKVK